MQGAHSSFWVRVGDGVFAIDTGFQRDRFDAAYLLVDGGRAAFIDTGTNHAVPRLLAALADQGLGPDEVDWVIPTHVHLDHAGGAGLLMQHLPAARLLIHPRGVRHLVDPSRLWASATGVYGEAEMARSYGQVVPVPAARVAPSSDGQVVQVGRRPLALAHTPGHARHHHCIWDARTRGWFTGDTFGLSYREFDTAQGSWMLPSSTPVQFDPAALRHSIQRLLAAQPDCMYLTHFSRVGDVARLGPQLLALLDGMVELGLRLATVPGRHQALVDAQLGLLSASLRAHGCTLGDDAIAALLAMDLELNAQGLAIWLDRPPAMQSPARLAGSS